MAITSIDHPAHQRSSRRTCGAWLILAVLLIGTSAGSAQTQNQIVSLGFNASFQDIPLPTVVPGGIVTLFTSTLNVSDADATEAPLPNVLSGVSVKARVLGASFTNGYPASLPILRVHSVKAVQMPNGFPCPSDPIVICSHSEITVQIPTELVCAQKIGQAPGCAVRPPLLVLNVQANGVTGPDLVLQVELTSPHVLNSCDSIFGPQSSATCEPVITHGDGTLISARNPARVGEMISLYAVGVGVDYPQTGYAPTRPFQILNSGFTSIPTVFFEFTLPLPPDVAAPGSRVFATTKTVLDPDWAGLVPGYVGLFQINVKVPPVPGGAGSCSQGGNGSVKLNNTIGAVAVSICVQP